jgi:hypothetical protein
MSYEERGKKMDEFNNSNPLVVESKQRKDKTITFRLSKKVYDNLEKLAKVNNITLSETLHICLENHFQDLTKERNMARFLCDIPEDHKDLFLSNEQLLPESFRPLTHAMQKYPDMKKWIEENRKKEGNI